MSKEFQIRDGNLIASFDLENEDGDIDFCKLLKVSHGVADEIGMFVDYVATNKIIKDQSKQISDLEAKLAESEARAERTKNWYNEKAGECAELKQQLAEKNKEYQSFTKIADENVNYLKNRILEETRNYNQDKISFAVEQLELLKYYIRLDNSDEETGDMSYIVDTTCLFELIDNQIKQLKEMK